MVDTLSVRGKPADVSESAQQDPGTLDLDEIGYEISQRVDTTVPARDGGDVVELAVDEGDVLEVTDSNGVTTFMSADEALRTSQSRGGRLDLAAPSVTRGMGVGITEVVQSRIGDDVRGLGKTVADWGVDQLLDPAARVTMAALAKRLDLPSKNPARGHARARGVYVVDDRLMLTPENLVNDAVSRSTKPFLVMLHGTFSNTEASFGGLSAGTGDDWRSVLATYGDRTLALEHGTLGLTPVENALQLAQALPDGARIHLLSHSRGGLIGEVLTCAARGTPPLGAYDRRGQTSHPDVLAWQSLGQVLRDKEVSVERFVRVACPARGTLLASRKLDRWATYFFNALKLIPGLDSYGVLSVVKRAVLVLLEQRLDVRAVPGLECMVPESALVATLAGVEQPVDDGLFAVTGDVEGKGLLGRIALAMPDLFFEGDHDLVVNTSAMAGGVPRTGMKTELFKGPDHTHFGYFTTTRSRAAIRDWLAPQPGGVRGAIIDEGERTRPSREERRRSRTGPRLVLVPDLMGSVLRSENEEIWPAPGAISRRGVASVLIPGTPGLDATASSLVATYADLVAILGRDFTVVAFPYDWRLPLEEAADRLREELDQDPHSHVLGHGAGCLIALAACTGTDRRPVLLDPPFERRAALRHRERGDDDLTRALALLDGETNAQAVGAVLGGHPGFAAKRDAEQSLWATTNQPVPPFVCVHDNAHAGHGQVTLECHHYLSRTTAGSLLSDPNVLEDLRRLLQGRSPQGLVPGQPAASPPEPEVQPDKTRELLFPTSEELARMALGSTTAAGPQPVSLLVRVTHGDLRTRAGPWVVGAQDGTPIGGSEKALDERLEGALTTHRQLGQYPGPTGSLQLFTCADFHGAAAAVMGLGAPGELTPGQLTAGVTQAVLRLAAANANLPPTTRADDGLEHRGSEISCVLCGTVGTGALPIETAVNSIITGVRRANRKLSDLERTRIHGQARTTQTATVGSLELVEVYEDRAVLALQAATKLAQSDGSSDEDVLQVVKTLQVGLGGRKGSASAGYSYDRWRTIKMSAAERPTRETGESAPGDADEMVQLKFTEVGRSAGAETLVTSGQRRVIDQVVQESIRSDLVAQSQVHNTLYELLVPLHMKGQGRPSDNIMFILDAHAAVLPLEMLATRSYDDSIVPLAVEVGLIRRLETSTFRQHVRPASGNRALVIGDPRAAGWPALAGARAEGNHVADALERYGYQVERLISASDEDDSVATTRVLDALYAHDYRIIHIAGHGRIDGLNGVVIGPEERLTALEIYQMQTTPDLVFLNCCHLGAGLKELPPGGVQPEWRPDRFAAGIARQLIDNGVRAVVAAGWAVADDAASAFAEQFYADLLGGQDLGPSVLAARKLVYRNYNSTSTWGAYQVYGSPAMQLQSLHPETGKTELTSPKAMRERLYDLTRQAAQLPTALERVEKVEEISADLTRILREVPSTWIDGEVHQTVGEIWRNLGHYREAIDAFQDALGTWSEVAALNVVDQIVSAHVRLGAQTAQDPAKRRTAKANFSKALNVIRTIDSLAKTPTTRDKGATSPERLELRATFAQHHLWVRVEDRVDALKEARDAFAQARDAFERVRRPDRYCTLFEITFRWLIHQLESPQTKSWEEDLQKVARLRVAAAKERWSPKPFAQLGTADCDLVTALLSVGSLPAVDLRNLAFGVAEEYEAGFRRGLSERELSAIHDDIALLREVLPPDHEAQENLLSVIAEELKDI